MADRLTYSPTKTAQVLGVSRSTVYQLMKRADFPAFKVGSRTLVSAEGLQAWVQAQVERGGKRMIDSIKQTRSGAATLERAEAGAGLARSSTSTDDFTTATGSRQRISDLLGHGQSAAVPLRHLKELSCLPGREVRRMIQSERLRGIPILSDNISGYYLAADVQEQETFIRSMRGWAAEIAAVAAAVEKEDGNSTGPGHEGLEGRCSYMGAPEQSRAEGMDRG